MDCQVIDMKIFKIKSMYLVLLLVLILISSLAFAQIEYLPKTLDGLQSSVTGVPVPQDQLKATSTQAVEAFSKVVGIANAAISSIQNNNSLKEYGTRLALSLTGIVVVWSIIKNIALKQALPQLIGDLVFPIFIAGLTIGLGIEKLPTVIYDTVTSLAGHFGAGGTDGMEMSMAQSYIVAITNIWNADSPTSGISALFSTPLQSFTMLLLRLGIMFLMLVAAGLGVAAILVAKFQIALAIAVAPLLIPWILFKPTEFLFSGWLNFFLKAGFGLVGVFAVSSVVAKGAAEMVNLIKSTDSSIAGIMTYAAMGAMTIIFTYLMLKGSDIGEGIIGGSATGIGQLTSVAKGSAASSPARMAGMAAKGAGSAGKVGAAAAAGKMMQGGGGGRLSEAGRAAVNGAFGSSGLAKATFEEVRSATPKKDPSNNGFAHGLGVGTGKS